jgi:hypothetical protein
MLEQLPQAQHSISLSLPANGMLSASLLNPEGDSRNNVSKFFGSVS